MTTNLIWTKPGTGKSFKPSGGDYAISLTSLGNNAGRISAKATLWADMSAPRGEDRWTLICQLKPAATPTAGNYAKVALCFWDPTGTYQQGGGTLGASDAAITAEADLNNCWLRQIVVEAASSRTIIGIWHGILIPTPYVSLGIWNATGAALTGTGTDHFAVLLPTPPEIQAAA